jgi:hypothetical protein
VAKARGEEGGKGGDMIIIMTVGNLKLEKKDL